MPTFWAQVHTFVLSNSSLMISYSGFCAFISRLSSVMFRSFLLMSHFCSVFCLIVIRLWCVSPCKNQTDLFYFALRQFRKPISLWHIRLDLFPKSAWNDHQNDEQISILCILSLLYLSNYEINTWQGCTFWSQKLEPSEVCQTFALKSLDFFSEVDKKWQIRNDNMALNLLGNKLINWFQTRVCQIWTATYAFSYVYSNHSIAHSSKDFRPH